MALLTSTQLATLRRKIYRDGVAMDAVKGEFNLALQAVEDWFDVTAVKTSLSSAIDDATTHTFNAEQKKKIVKYWLENRSGRE